MKDMKKLIQIANIVQTALVNLHKSQYLQLLKQIRDLSSLLKRLSIEAKKLGFALSRDWSLAADRCSHALTSVLDELAYVSPRILQRSKDPRHDVPKLAFLVQELQQLQLEFGQIAFSKENKSISVTTESIALGDVYLGPFSIELQLDRLPELYHHSVYRIVALEPHPAACDIRVTHPHVSDEKLCEGDGCLAIRKALEQGRLCDFFSLVNSILTNYNSGSPYVSLDNWEGTACYECGYTMSSDDIWHCSYCDYDYCEECITSCICCQEIVCTGCSVECEYCGDKACHNCLGKCSECDSTCCIKCLENDICPSCKEEMETQNEDQEQTKQESQEHNLQTPSTS